MDSATVSQIASDIRLIKWAFIFVPIILTAMAGIIIWLCVKLAFESPSDKPSETIQVKADRLIEEYKTDELIDFAQSLLKDNPNHVMGLYSLAIGHYQKGQLSESLQYFQRVIELNPPYEPYAIKPYIDAIKSKINNSGS
jgi:tetratricopeptide (TPR) repeat protein